MLRNPIFDALYGVEGVCPPSGSAHELLFFMGWHEKNISRTLIIAIAYANMSCIIVFTLQMPHSYIKWRRQPDPQWVHKTEVYCVLSKCYAGGKDGHVHHRIFILLVRTVAFF